MGEPHRQPEGQDGGGGDRAGGGRRPPEARLHGRRVHRREHRRVAGAGVRGQRLPDPDRELRRVRAGEARRDGGAGGGADARPEPGGPHHPAADSGHDRSRARAEPGAADLLDRPAAEPRHDRRLCRPRRGDLGADRRAGGRFRALRRHGGVLARGGDRAQAPGFGDRVRGGRAGGVLGAARRCGRAAQDRRRRDRLPASALGPVARGRHPARGHERGEGDDPASRARGGAVRRDLVRRERRGRDPGRGAAGSRRPGGHADGRLGPQVPEHRPVPIHLCALGSKSQ